MNQRLVPFKGANMKGNYMADSTRKATLNLDGKSFELPIHSPTAGPDVLDIRKLYAEAGVFTYDPGFTSTASCDSTITYIDGGKGELLHRGYPIDQLAEKSHHCHLKWLSRDGTVIPLG